MTFVSAISSLRAKDSSGPIFESVTGIIDSPYIALALPAQISLSAACFSPQAPTGLICLGSSIEVL
jgi:hypothetical protein